MTHAERIRAIRGAQTKDAFAAEVGVGRQSAYAWEKDGERVTYPKEENAARLAAIARARGWPDATPALFLRPPAPSTAHLRDRLEELVATVATMQGCLEAHDRRLERLEQPESEQDRAQPANGGGRS